MDENSIPELHGTCIPDPFRQNAILAAVLIALAVISYVSSVSHENRRMRSASDLGSSTVQARR